MLRLCEGAAVRWGAETYLPAHPTYGSIGAVQSLAEGVGDEVPAGQIELLPPSTTTAAALLIPGAQKSRVQAWQAELDLNTSTVIGTPTVLFFGFLDQARLTRSVNALSLKISVVSLLEQLFELNIGNGLNPSFHKSIWPGETGEDQATGLVLQDAWGVEAPSQTGSFSSGGTGGFSGPGFVGGKVVSV